MREAAKDRREAEREYWKDRREAEREWRKDAREYRRWARGEYIPRHYLADRYYMQDYRSHDRSEEHTSELQSLMRISYAVFCLKNKNNSHIQDTPLEVQTKHIVSDTELA